jgi:hypothetical protein
MFPCGFVYGVVIPLDFVEPSSLVARDSVMLVENLDGSGIHDHPFRTPKECVSCRHRSSNEIGRLECLFGFASPSLLPPSQCQDQR